MDEQAHDNDEIILPPAETEPGPENAVTEITEPTVLDFVKDRLMFWRRSSIHLPDDELPAGSVSIADIADAPAVHGEAEATTPIPAVKVRFPWGPLAVLAVAILAQLLLEPQAERNWINGVVLYAIAGAAAVVGALRGEWRLTETEPQDQAEGAGIQYHLRVTPLLAGLICAVVAYIGFQDAVFNDLNVLLWTGALVGVLLAFRESGVERVTLRERVQAILNRENWSIVISPWSLLVLAAFLVAVYFRVYRLAEVPPEMVSDHAEKLWDVRDLLNGWLATYFPRNTGREFFQFYLTAAVVRLFNTGLSFLSLKIGTVICGILTLPFIYLIGKEVANRRVGLIAMAFAGVAYWPNVISRIALRFTLYPFFYAPTIYFFLRGLRTKRLRDFVLSGVFLGLGLNGYSPFRIVPVLLVVCLVLYLLHRKQSEDARLDRLTSTSGLLLTALTSFILFIPLLRYVVEHPLDVMGRSLTRLGEWEKAYDGNPLLIFLDNLWRGLAMFGWDDGEVWVNSVVHRPALDAIAAALFHLGVILLIVRYIRRRDWRDLFTLVSIPILLMPSILSIAFPAENPSLNRASGAIIPVFLIIGMALDGLMTTLQRSIGGKTGVLAAAGLALLLFAGSARQNYDLVFNQYQEAYETNAWNTSEAGIKVREFADLHGTYDTVYTIASPYWFDTRLVMLAAGYPDRDSELNLEYVETTVADPRAKLFIVRHFPVGADAANEEANALAVLRYYYPGGWAELYQSGKAGKDFWLYFTPANPDVYQEIDLPPQP